MKWILVVVVASLHLIAADIFSYHMRFHTQRMITSLLIFHVQTVDWNMCVSYRCWQSFQRENIQTKAKENLTDEEIEYFYMYE